LGWFGKMGFHLLHVEIYTFVYAPNHLSFLYRVNRLIELLLCLHFDEFP